MQAPLCGRPPPALRYLKRTRKAWFHIHGRPYGHAQIRMAQNLTKRQGQCCYGNSSHFLSSVSGVNSYKWFIALHLPTTHKTCVSKQLQSAKLQDSTPNTGSWLQTNHIHTTYCTFAIFEYRPLYHSYTYTTIFKILHYIATSRVFLRVTWNGITSLQDSLGM